ncbi:MAG: type II toxin-antitoxin system RelE/ParE family toxin [Nitrospinae bacterium]|nr:type II toxin-antitoxin system RelE/ParE family toxin [Nitrospinota bacterium]
MKWRVEVLPSAADAMERLEKRDRSRVARAVDALASKPRPSGAKKLRNEGNRWRIRVGDHRIIYDIRDRELIILVIKLGHRKDVYR